MYTKQEIFNIVAKHLLTQNEKSVDEHQNGMCMYRSKDGLKCAIGCLIDDNHYNSYIESVSIMSLTVSESNINANSLKRALVNSNIAINDYATLCLMSDLQSIHDRNNIEHWNELLVYTARKFNLNKKVIEEEI